MFEPKLPPQEKLALIEDFASMLSAGIPILETVETIIEDTTNKAAKKILNQAATDLKSGKTLSTTFGKFPQNFDLMTVNFIKAGEASGNLERVLKDLAKLIKSQIKLSTKVKSALMYPAFVLGVLVLTLTAMLFLVLPRISKVLKRLKMDLPLPTQILIFISDFTEANRIWVVTGVAALAILIFAALKIEKARRFLIGILTKLPLVSSLILRFDLAYFCRTMSLLLPAGIPVTESLTLAIASVSSPKIMSGLKKVEGFLREGKGFSEGLSLNKEIFPAMMRRLISTGEQTGGLGKSFAELSQRYEQKTLDTVENLIAMLEPVLIVVIGVGIGGIILSIIAPIYNLIGQLRV